MMKSRQWPPRSTRSADSWTPIQYPHAAADPDTGELISDAEVAETDFTAFVSRRKHERITCRLVVRRVKRLNTGAKTGEVALFDTYRYHAFITNSTRSAVEADATHRRHAIVEQVIAELKNGPLAHLPSGRFHANAAWPGFAVTAFNISRAAAVAADTPAARMATVLATIVAVPARLASRARRKTVQLPTSWPCGTPGPGSVPRRPDRRAGHPLHPALMGATGDRSGKATAQAGRSCAPSSERTPPHHDHSVREPLQDSARWIRAQTTPSRDPYTTLPDATPAVPRGRS